MPNLLGGVSVSGCVYFLFSKKIMIRGWFFPLIYDEIEVFNNEEFLGICNLYLSSEDVYKNIDKEEAKNCRFFFESEADFMPENIKPRLVVKKNGKIIKIVNDIRTELSQCAVEVDNNGNTIIGSFTAKNATVFWGGKNNVLFCEDNVTLTNSALNFRGDNSLIFLGGRGNYKLEVDIYNDSVLCFGKNNAFSDKVRIILSEQRHCLIGDNCIFSIGIIIRNSDAHLIYDGQTGERINFSKSVYIGDHVWVGQSAAILKGAEIDSGSIIAAGSVVTGKKIPHNTVWAGIPCRQIRREVFWDKTSVHAFQEEDTMISRKYIDLVDSENSVVDLDMWRFQYVERECVEWSVLEKSLSKGSNVDKCSIILKLSHEKNRFVHNIL